ncbi:uncharacterized protein LOC135936514 [Cloeon dipterum]|uniref:uncharacterized protein LOC135936514 n=1 Tax=Cloeon dipterum TaxID=197152 RepID=UPI00321FF260
MKRLLLVISVICSISFAKQNSPFEEVHELLNYGELLRVPEKDLIFLFGSSGVDKSTLTKFVIKDETLKVRRKGSKLVFESKRSQNRTQFQDVLPHFYQDKATGNVLVDVPGFTESREPKLDIAGAYFTKSALQHAESLKLIFVENHANLMDGADTAPVLKLLRHAAKQLPRIEVFKNSVGLVVAKVHDQQGDDSEILSSVLNQLLAVKDELDFDLTEQDKYSGEYNETFDMLEVLGSIYANGTAENIALFRNPDQETSPWASEMMSKCQQELRVLFFGSLDFCPTDGVQFPFSILHRSRDYIMQNIIPKNNKLATRFLAKILNEFQVCIESAMKINHKINEKASFISKASLNFQELILTGGIFDSLDALLSLKEKLTTVCDAWRNIDLSIMQNLIKSTQLAYDLASADISNFLDQVEQTVIDKSQIIKGMDDFYTFLQRLTVELKSYEVQILRKSAFLEVSADNYKDFIFNLSKFKIKVANKDKLISLKPTRQMIQDLNSILNRNLNHTTRRSFNNFGQELIYEGRNLILSEIAPELGKFQKLQNLYLFAQGTIFIDCDLVLVDANVSLAAPTIEVIGGNLTFNMSGRNGKSASPRLSSSPKDGSPGEDGHNAGHTLILALEVKRGAQLTIASKGGNGGDGQDGARGLEGVSSPSPHFTDFYPEFVSGVANWGPIKSHGYSIEHPDKGTLVLVNKQGARPPTNGGHGGAGGKGGKAGHNFFLVWKDDHQLRVQAADGLSGRHGKGGKGGEGKSTCAKNIYSGKCKTRECEMLRLAAVFFVESDTKNECRCMLQKKEFCETEPDAADGLAAYFQSIPSPSTKLVDWQGLEAKLNKSALFRLNSVGSEDEEELKNYVEYARSTVKTAMQIFSGMNFKIFSQ